MSKQAVLANMRTSMEIDTIAEVLRITEQMHEEVEHSLPRHDWQDWYSAFLYAVDHGADNETAQEAANIYIRDITKSAKQEN